MKTKANTFKNLVFILPTYKFIPILSLKFSKILIGYLLACADGADTTDGGCEWRLRGGGTSVTR